MENRTLQAKLNTDFEKIEVASKSMGENTQNARKLCKSYRWGRFCEYTRGQCGAEVSVLKSWPGAGCQRTEGKVAVSHEEQSEMLFDKGSSGSAQTWPSIRGRASRTEEHLQHFGGEHQPGEGTVDREVQGVSGGDQDAPGGPSRHCAGGGCCQRLWGDDRQSSMRLSMGCSGGFWSSQNHTVRPKVSLASPATSCSPKLQSLRTRQMGPVSPRRSMSRKFKSWLSRWRTCRRYWRTLRLSIKRHLKK